MKRLSIFLICLYGLCMAGVISVFIVSVTYGLPLKKVDKEVVEETEESEKLNEISTYEIRI